MSDQPNLSTNFTTFADWCFHKDSLPEAAKHTVKILLEKAKTSDCYEADRILSNLTELNLNHNRIADISPLSALTNLTQLDLRYNQIGDISPLSALTNLRSLNLRSNQIADISPLIVLTNLRSLDLYNNQIADISPLITLTNLTSLTLSFNQIADISLLIALTNLTSLDLEYNPIVDFSPLIALTNLTSLDLRSNQIADISPLIALTNLRSLYLDNNPIVDLSPLQSLNQLDSVRIYDVNLPKKYFSSLHQWQAQWLLEEDNAEIRQLLIQVIGYDRICQELQATELDSWREYILLKIEIFDDFDEDEFYEDEFYWYEWYEDGFYAYECYEYKFYEDKKDKNEYPIYLLKMTCPSTGHIHVLRVPPDIKLAREAIRWVNWGIDPEEFAVQT